VRDYRAIARGTQHDMAGSFAVAASLAIAFGCIVLAFRLRAAARAERCSRVRAAGRHAAFRAATLALTNSARDSAAAVRTTLAGAIRALAPSVDGVLVFEPHDAALTCVAAFGPRFAYYAGMTLALDDTASLPVRAVVAGHHVTLRDEGVRPLHAGDAAAVAIPLIAGERYPCAVVAAAPAAIDADTLARLVALAEHASPAYAIARDRERDRHAAEYDGLTGLLTPHAFRRKLNALVEAARFSCGAGLALLFLDTDRFKQYNDGHGHAAGDALLREIAGVLRGAAGSPRDLVARNGGDEFCLVFTDTGKAAAIERAAHLRRRIAALGLARPCGADAPEDTARITASIGVAAFPADAASGTDLLECADAAMYHAKNTGRDGVSYAGGAGRFIRLAA
jgi:diguanylate cyclase (GGDEF)-like protein